MLQIELNRKNKLEFSIFSIHLIFTIFHEESDYCEHFKKRTIFMNQHYFYRLGFWLMRYCMLLYGLKTAPSGNEVLGTTGCASMNNRVVDTSFETKEATSRILAQEPKLAPSFRNEVLITDEVYDMEKGRNEKDEGCCYSSNSTYQFLTWYPLQNSKEGRKNAFTVRSETTTKSANPPRCNIDH